MSLLKDIIIGSLVGGSVGFIGYAAYKVIGEQLAPSPNVGDEGETLTAFTTAAVLQPNGDWAFKPDLAQSLIRSLGGQSFRKSTDDPLLVRIMPDPGGMPISFEQTALAWAKPLRKTHSILAPYYMAMTGSKNRYLKAVPKGTEAANTGPDKHGFVVLLYAGVGADSMTQAPAVSRKI